MWKMQCMDQELKYRPNKENMMTEAVLSTCPNMIPNDIPPPSIDNNNTHSCKPESSFVDEPAATQSSEMVTENHTEDQKVTQRDEGTVVMVEENLRETSEEQRPGEDNTIIKESQKETKAGNNGSSKKKKKPKTKKRKNSTVF